MHWLEDPPSFDLFANITNLSVEQREYARTLGAGFAVVRSPFGRPVHIKVPESSDQPDDDVSDAAVRLAMARQRAALGLDDVPIVAWDSAPTATNGHAAQSSDVLNVLVGAPMQTCAFCKPLHTTRTCQYGATVRRRFLADDPAKAEQSTAFVDIMQRDDVWSGVRQFGANVERRVAALAPNDRHSIAYCLMAHLAHEHVTSSSSCATRACDVLAQFDQKYSI
jgi:hypothetical protein